MAPDVGYFTDYFSAAFDTGAAAPEPVQPRSQQPRAVRSRTLRRSPKRYIEREIDTPDGPMIVLVPDDWTADNLMTLTTALVLADALH